MFGYAFFIDPSRCIGCQSCVQACAECETHRGSSMIYVDYLDRPSSIATVPMVCMHCDDPTCAQVCPADAIKKGDDGVVHSSLKPRCIACSNCVLACPFGVPMVKLDIEQMTKCDMCYDRTSEGKRPMCATVCPSQALAYVRPEEIAANRREVPTSVFGFGLQTVTTLVQYLVPGGRQSIQVEAVDIVDHLWEGDDAL